MLLLGGSRPGELTSADRDQVSLSLQVLEKRGARSRGIAVAASRSSLAMYLSTGYQCACMVHFSETAREYYHRHTTSSVRPGWLTRASACTHRNNEIDSHEWRIHTALGAARRACAGLLIEAHARSSPPANRRRAISVQASAGSSAAPHPAPPRAEPHRF